MAARDGGVLSPPSRHGCDATAGSAALVPDFVTHYHLADRQPFLNLSELAMPQASAVMGELMALGASGEQHRVFGRVYLQWRWQTEEKLRKLFVQRGGVPERAAPHYFVLGESRWYRGLARHMQAVRLPLAALPELQTSFTVIDSFSAMGLGAAFGHSYTPAAHESSVYLLADLPDVVGRHGLPRDEEASDYTGYAHRPVTSYVEVQLWSDEPIREHLAARPASPQCR